MLDPTSKPITIRHRLQDYEFSDEQKMTLTIELLNRIEKDVEDLKSARTRDGFSVYITLAGIATITFILLGVLAKVKEISLSKISIVFFALILLLKIPWAIYQLIATDQAQKKRYAPGRFFWSNDFFFELRPTGIFQSMVFFASLILTFLIQIPFWVKAFTGLSFLFYFLIVGLVLVFSLRKEAYVPSSSKKPLFVGIPILFVLSTILAVIGLTYQMDRPIGDATESYLIAGLTLTIVFFIDLLIRLSTPSLLLEKLQRLRYDIIFLRIPLEEAWTQYEIYIDGHDISEELRSEMDDIIQYFNIIEQHQSQKVEFLTKIKEELLQIQTRKKITATDFESVNVLKNAFFFHFEEINRVLEELNQRLENLNNQIMKISRSTQEWQRADEYHQYILSRFKVITEKESLIQQDAEEVDRTIALLMPRNK